MKTHKKLYKIYKLDKKTGQVTAETTHKINIPQGWYYCVDGTRTIKINHKTVKWLVRNVKIRELGCYNSEIEIIIETVTIRKTRTPHPQTPSLERIEHNGDNQV